MCEKALVTTVSTKNATSADMRTVMSEKLSQGIDTVQFCRAYRPQEKCICIMI